MEIELVANIFQLPRTFGTSTVERVNIFFVNDAARKACHVFTTSSNLSEKGLSITSPALLHSSMKSCFLGYITEENVVYRDCHETCLNINRAAEVPPLAM